MPRSPHYDAEPIAAAKPAKAKRERAKPAERWEPAKLNKGKQALGSAPDPAKARSEPVAAGRVHLLTLADLDGRSNAYKKTRALVEGIYEDLGGAGELTVAQEQLVQRAAILGAVCEDFETRWLMGQPVDAAAYLATVNAQRRVLATLGLERRARDVTPTLTQVLKEHEQRKRGNGR